MNAKTQDAPTTEAERELDELSWHLSNNPLFGEDPNTTMTNVGSVLSLLRDYVRKEESPGIDEQFHPGAALILRCAIGALTAQCEYSDLKSRVNGGAA